MPEDKKFDLTHPGQVSPHASGRPVIVGHHPMMTDPMLRPTHHIPQSQQTVPQPIPRPQPAYSEPPNAMGATQPQQPIQPQQPMVPPTPQPSPNQPFEPIGALPSQIQPLPAVSDGLTPQPQQHMAQHELPISNHKTTEFGLKKFLLWIVMPLLGLLVLSYLLIDAGVVNTNIKLPFHIFKKTTVVVTKNPTESSATPPAPTTPSVPAGFSAYNDSALPFSFNYPTLWGTPTVTTEQGYSKRSSTTKTDGTYAYLVSFASNKDVQIAVTSAKYLPPVRQTPLYYDFLAWCTGQSADQYFKSLLTFTTANGVDIPGDITCNQGPLTDVTKIDGSTIVQINTKAADGSSLGSIYTKNLNSPDIPVVRIKDATGKNGDSIKVILNTNQANNKTTP